MYCHDLHPVPINLSSQMYVCTCILQIYIGDAPSHFVDACNCKTANWMRYVNCARSVSEQNVTAYQYCGEIYYRAHCDILVSMKCTNSNFLSQTFQNNKNRSKLIYFLCLGPDLKKIQYYYSCI
jgi:hypothetical protein